ncbi:DUF7937 domain-containing protein [Devriesea agamarum]|uniref:DUF7937 domain-containing protein n=1 Tax=Devriesea agamarum TaxID=472569 RepID=UPI00071CEA68|nr:hypothetical protein [Devriesea agamarum]
MAKDNKNNRCDDWIFAESDPDKLPTEELPNRRDLDEYTASPGRFGALGPQQGSTPLPAHSATTTGLAAPRPSGAPSHASGPSGAPTAPNYARSGTTPTQEDDDPQARLRALAEPLRVVFRWDLARDLLAIICFFAACVTQFTWRHQTFRLWLPMTAIIIAVIGIILAYVLRFTALHARRPVIRRLRILTQIPVMLVALGTIIWDLISSIPVMFSPLVTGPPVGIGVAVSLALAGSVLAAEPRGHEGHIPGEQNRWRARLLLKLLSACVAVCFVIMLVMLIGRAVTGDWTFSLLNLATAIISSTLVVIPFAAGLRRHPSWYIFGVTCILAMILGAIADNSLKLSYAAPESFAITFVWLPFLFAGFSVLVSRAFLRGIPLSFTRSDWIVYAVRAFEFSAILHCGACLWNTAAAIAASAGEEMPAGPLLYLISAVVSVMVVVLSLVGRHALLHRPADAARATAVVCAVIMVVIGFLGVIVETIVAQAAAGVSNGGLALALGLAIGLMLTVPAPIRDEYGAPDLARMFEDFRRRGGGRTSLRDRVPDVAAHRARKASFPREQ